MPIYDYHCKACKKVDDYRVERAEEHPLQCRHCGVAGKLEREVIQAFTPHTKNNANSDSDDTPFQAPEYMTDGRSLYKAVSDDEVKMRHGRPTGKAIVPRDPAIRKKMGAAPIYEFPDPSSN